MRRVLFALMLAACSADPGYEDTSAREPIVAPCDDDGGSTIECKSLGLKDCLGTCVHFAPGAGCGQPTCEACPVCEPDSVYCCTNNWSCGCVDQATGQCR